MLYGSASGVSARDQLWHQGRKGVKGALRQGRRFGDVLACGDFDGDGSADLVVGLPYADVGSVYRAGLVQVLYGGPHRLTARDQIWHQDQPGVPGKNEKSDQFGKSLVTGDFDGDGYADLVVGVPLERVRTLGQAGRVVVIRGSPDGLTTSGVQTLRHGKAGIPSPPTRGWGFGNKLAAGDVNGDGHADLAAGVYQPTDDGRGSAVQLLLGGYSGLTPVAGQYIQAADLGMWPSSVFTLTFSDFDRDAHADLVLASTAGPCCGTAVLHGHDDGLHPAPLAMAETPGADARWWVGSGDEDYGAPVAAGDLTGDSYPDLVVGHEVILGTADGLGPTWVDWPVGWSSYGDIAVLPFSGGSHAWLAAEPEKQPTGLPETAGAVSVLRGTATGDPGPVTVWTQDSAGIKGEAEQGDSFGSSIGGGRGPLTY